MRTCENLVLGLDLGIGSCGWALIGTEPVGERIVALGVRTFDVPETDKERTPTNQLRRQFRGMRRVIKRRRQRMNDIRSLFAAAGLLPDDGKDALKAPGLDPWQLRAEGLDRRLSGAEFAVALGHIAKHRGFRSNSKRDRGANAPKDSSDMLKAIAANQERMQGRWRTVGDMFAHDEAYAGRKRNRDGEYSRSILRDDQSAEVRELFSSQRRLGNSAATEDLERRFVDIAFYQRPFQDSEHLVGACPFEPGEKRAAKRAYSFELFRLLAKLASLRIRGGTATPRALAPEEIAAAIGDFGAKKGISFKRLRGLIGLSDDDRFEDVPREEESKRDVVTRSGDMAVGSYALRKVVGEAGWKSLIATAPERLDRLSAILTFREDVDSIRAGLAELDLEPLILIALMKGVEAGEFAGFRGAAHLSAKACRKLIPHLKRGLVYSRACEAAGYNHAARPATDLDQIANPVARKALTEAVKQVRAIVAEYGLPGQIHVELAREVGKSKEERDEISRGIEKRNKAKDRLRDEFRETVGVECSGAEDLLRYELWKEQDGRCIYTDRAIHPNAIVASDNSVQVDHVLPWSRSGDDSFVNKTLCFTAANQEKRGRTVWEWFKAEKTEEEWEALVRRVETNKAMKGRKKRNYLLKDSSLLEEKFRPRNLNDTRYASRLLLELLARLYPEGDDYVDADREIKKRKRVLARPGPLTDRLRRGWGAQGLKKDADGNRVDDDRHHALDALIVAATSESALQSLTRAFQECERLGLPRDFGRLDPPWPGFLDEVRRKLPDVFVSRAERRRARGEAHAATVRQVGERDGEPVVYERKSVDALSEKDLERFKDPERNAATVEALRAWITAGKPKEARPRSPKGDEIRKVRLVTNKKPDVLIRDGAAERGEMVRVDVFRKANKKGNWEFFLVPIYPHQVVDAEDWPQPPNRAVQANTDEEKWPEVNGLHEFCWSLYPLSFIQAIKLDGEVIEGYLRGVSRSTGALTISPHHTKEDARPGIGTRTLKSFRKFYVNRLGRRSEIKRETRTWRGAACT